MDGGLYVGLISQMKVNHDFIFCKLCLIVFGALLAVQNFKQPSKS